MKSQETKRRNDLLDLVRHMVEVGADSDGIRDSLRGESDADAAVGALLAAGV